MGEWSEYFEDFPEENPANQPDYNSESGDQIRARQNYSPEFRAREQQVREAAKARQITEHLKKTGEQV